MELYGQDPELALLSALVPRLERRTMFDVGAERGTLAAAMLRAGIEWLDAFDPQPDNAAALRERFKGNDRVRVHEYALSDSDGTAELHVSSGPDGSPLPFGHTLLERRDTDEIAWRQTVPVARRTLESMIVGGELDGRVGILKIDAEGHDLAVLRGMGPLEADVVMVEHWTDLPHGLGLCPWTAQEINAELAPRGFAHFAFIAHRGEFVTLKWDDGEIERGAMGNLVFLHERLLPAALADVLACAGSLAEQAVQVGQMYMRAAAERLALINDLEQIAEERLQKLERATAALEARSASPPSG